MLGSQPSYFRGLNFSKITMFASRVAQRRLEKTPPSAPNAGLSPHAAPSSPAPNIAGDTGGLLGISPVVLQSIEKAVQSSFLKEKRGAASSDAHEADRDEADHDGALQNKSPARAIGGGLRQVQLRGSPGGGADDDGNSGEGFQRSVALGPSPEEAAAPVAAASVAAPLSPVDQWKRAVIGQLSDLEGTCHELQCQNNKLVAQTQELGAKLAASERDNRALRTALKEARAEAERLAKHRREEEEETAEAERLAK